MHPVSVIIADADGGRQARYARLLAREDTEVAWQAASCNDLLARLQKLKPRILLFSLDLCSDAECSLLQSLRRDCPSTRVVLLADQPVMDDRLVQALATGACGYLEHQTCEQHLAKAVHCVDRGEAWVPRKLLGRMMDSALH